MTVFTDDQIIDRFFANHEAIRTQFKNVNGNQIIEGLGWQDKDGSKHGRIHYLFILGSLFITGDMGSAAHHWGRPIDLEFFRGFYDISEFSERCAASETGRGNRGPGDVPSVNCRAHLIGLRMACEALEGVEAKTG